MHEQQRPAAARRRRVTPENLIEAGIGLTLAKLTVKSIADKLGVSIVAVYNNIDDLDSLKKSVAEAIMDRWDLPTPLEGDSFEQSLTLLSNALKDVVQSNQGIATYLANLDETSPALIRVNDCQKEYARIYGLTPKQTLWAFLTVTEHAMALADLRDRAGASVRIASTQPPQDDRLDFLAENFDRTHTEDDYWNWSMRAVIVGVDTLINDPQFDDL
ncbi:hypothetical protein QMK17_18910 [Rhodococcus sp. G-MC3]|uniref:TetR/AcrR family transcriptional regulator n=1 Tax=Rhodococcus sp. G-MC3 TaxID=3046209 RepID=UPI0024B9E3CC|nr:hypothetical protein [Rhodococcus sp. G-MC3]MDJ0395398.1 hypothetical protein [Rhodococcus sp. G-MC3]